MGELLHLSSLVPAAVGACCTLGARRSGRAASALSALLTLAAMLDVASGTGVVPVIAWAGLLLLTAVITSATSRPRGRIGGHAGEKPGRAGHPVSMDLHGRLGLVVMAAVLLAMGAPELGHGSGPVSAGHHGGGGATLGAIALAAASGYAVFSGFVAMRAVKAKSMAAPARGGAAIEALSMGASVMLMTAAVWV